MTRRPRGAAGEHGAKDRELPHSARGGGDPEEEELGVPDHVDGTRIEEAERGVGGGKVAGRDGGFNRKTVDWPALAAGGPGVYHWRP